MFIMISFSVENLRNYLFNNNLTQKKPGDR